MQSPLFRKSLVLALVCISQDVFGFAPSAVAVIKTAGRQAQRAPITRTSTSVVVSSSSSAAQRAPITRTSTSVVVSSSSSAEAVSSISAAVPPKLQALLVLSSVLVLAGYHINLFVKERNSNEKTWRAYQAEARENWSRHVRTTEGWLYAVQTLRNAITAQTFLATTVLSLLTLITGRLWDILRALPRGAERRLLTVQLISVALTMLLSAYQFLQGVRLMTHAGFLFPVVSEGTVVDNIMRRSQNCQWSGLRYMYCSLGPITWAVGGSRAFFVTSICLLQFFRKIDRKPKGMGYEAFQGGGI